MAKLPQVLTADHINDVMHRERRLIEVLRNQKGVPLTVDEMAARANLPVSSTYKSVAKLESIGVLKSGKTTVITDTGRRATRKTYWLDIERANNYEAPLSKLAELPKYYNQVSKTLYSILDFAERYDPHNPVTGGVKAAASYLEVAVMLLALSTHPDGDSVENMRKQQELRNYLLTAQLAVDNVRSQISQMLEDSRLWTKDLYVLGAQHQIVENEAMLKAKADQIVLG